MEEKIQQQQEERDAQENREFIKLQAEHGSGSNSNELPSGLIDHYLKNRLPEKE